MGELMKYHSRGVLQSFTGEMKLHRRRLNGIVEEAICTNTGMTFPIIKIDSDLCWRSSVCSKFEPDICESFPIVPNK